MLKVPITNEERVKLLSDVESAAMNWRAMHEHFHKGQASYRQLVSAENRLRTAVEAMTIRLKRATA